MEGFIADVGGGVWRLPPLIAWDMKYGLGEQADSFEASFLAGGDFYDTVHGCCRFYAGHQGKRVFTGVIDEYELTAGEEGAVTTIYGRSLQALLMDNEALRASYWGANLDTILENHVYPYGITEVQRADMAAASRLDVAVGYSQWRVLKEYCAFCGGVRPRFNREGTLLLDGSSGESYVIDQATAVTAQTVTERRWGVISEAVIYRRGAVATAHNEEFEARGGSARRIISVPRHTGYDAMRYTGSYQISQSAKNAYVCRVTLPTACAAFAGDRVTVVWSPLGVTGSFSVSESRCLGDGDGAVTILDMIREE